MKRLTTNKEVEEMSMMELSYNCMYSKDREAWYRNYEIEINLYEFIRIINGAYLKDRVLPEDKEELDDILCEDLQYPPTSPEGLIAHIYHTMWAMADLRERLMEYEDIGLTPKEIMQLKDDLYPFGKCKQCGMEFNSELVNEYNMKYCIKCGFPVNEENC